MSHGDRAPVAVVDGDRRVLRGGGRGRGKGRREGDRGAVVGDDNRRAVRVGDRLVLGGGTQEVLKGCSSATLASGGGKGRARGEDGRKGTRNCGRWRVGWGASSGQRRERGEVARSSRTIGVRHTRSALLGSKMGGHFGCLTPLF
jgi:hypothetical protein